MKKNEANTKNKRNAGITFEDLTEKICTMEYEEFILAVGLKKGVQDDGE